MKTTHFLVLAVSFTLNAPYAKAVDTCLEIFEKRDASPDNMEIYTVGFRPESKVPAVQLEAKTTGVTQTPPININFEGHNHKVEPVAVDPAAIVMGDVHGIATTPEVKAFVEQLKTKPAISLDAPQLILLSEKNGVKEYGLTQNGKTYSFEKPTYEEVVTGTGWGKRKQRYLRFATVDGVRSLKVRKNLSKDDLSNFAATSSGELTLFWAKKVTSDMDLTTILNFDRTQSSIQILDVLGQNFPVTNAQGKVVAHVAATARPTEASARAILGWLQEKIALKEDMSQVVIYEAREMSRGESESEGVYTIKTRIESVIYGFQEVASERFAMIDGKYYNPAVDGLQIIGGDNFNRRLYLNSENSLMLSVNDGAPVSVGSIPSANMKVEDVRVMYVSGNTIFEIPYVEALTKESSNRQAEGFVNQGVMITTQVSPVAGVFASVNRGVILDALKRPAQLYKSVIRVQVDAENNVSIVP